MIYVYVILGVFAAAFVYIFWYIRKQARLIERLYGHFAKMTLSQERIMRDHEQLMTAEQTAEQRIADKFEKKWDKGLENMMAYNPFIKQEAGDDV